MCFHTYIYFSRSATEECKPCSNVINKCSGSLESKALYMIAANRIISSKFFGSRFCVVVKLEHKGEKTGRLGGGVTDANSRAKVNRGIDMKCLTSNLPKRAAK